MREGRYIYFHGDGNPGVEFDFFSHGSSSEAGDSEDEDSGEVSTGLQVRVSIAPVIDQGLQSSGFIGIRKVKCDGPLSNVVSSRLRTILNTNNSRFPPALQYLRLADAKDVFQELPASRCLHNWAQFLSRGIGLCT